MYSNESKDRAQWDNYIEQINWARLFIIHRNILWWKGSNLDYFKIHLYTIVYHAGFLFKMKTSVS